MGCGKGWGGMAGATMAWVGRGGVAGPQKPGRERA